MKNITVIMKPTFSCNLRCKYCYHSETQYIESLMSEELLEKTISLVQSEYEDVMYVWHGGEPLLCGIEFYRKAVELQLKYAGNTRRIRNSIQTNGTIITDEMIDFCLKNSFSVSVSYDGPGELNRYRQNGDITEKNIKYMIQKGLPVAMLSVISRINVHEMQSIVDHAALLGIPVKLNPVFKTNTYDHSDYLIEPGDYIREFTALFDSWLYDQNARTDVEPIMQYIKMYLTGKGTECVYGSCMYHWIGVMQDGTVFPCGRNYPSEYALGNIAKSNSIEELFACDTYKKLTVDSILRREHCASTCAYFDVCRGGCNSNSLLTGTAEKPNADNCEMFKGCYGYIANKLSQIGVIEREKLNPYMRKVLPVV